MIDLSLIRGRGFFCDTQLCLGKKLANGDTAFSETSLTSLTKQLIDLFFVNCAVMRSLLPSLGGITT